MRKTTATGLILLALAMYALPAGTAELSGREILEKTIAPRPFKDMVMHVTLIKTRQSGRTRRIEMVIFRKNYSEMSNTLARVEAPEEAKGISFLTWDYTDSAKQDQSWYFIPAVGQYYELSDEKGKSYEEKFGFTMEIFKIDLNLAEHELLGEETLDGVPCYKVQSLTKDPQSPEGVKFLSWIRKDNWLAQKLQAFDQDGTMIHEFRLKNMEKVSDIWMETGGIYKDTKNQKTIEFSIDDIKIDSGVKDEVFLKSTRPDKINAP